MLIWAPMLLALAGAANGDPYARFIREFQAGADCPKLFDLRNEAKRRVGAARQDEMNDNLRSVQCFSSTSKRAATAAPRTGGFTVDEYRIYRSILAAPISIPEAQALQNAAKRHGVTVAEARKASTRVQDILFRNNWFATPEAEIRHALDWKGEKQ